MENIERRVRREVRAMTRREVITKVLARQLSWIQAAQVLDITPRQLRRIRQRYERWGISAVMDQRGGRPRRKRIKSGTVELLIRLKRDVYADFSVRHFYEQVTEKHQVRVSYNWLRLMLQEAGVVEKEPARGKYRRRRERRPMVGMLVHLDASTHEWIVGLPMQDLVIALDDADGRILYGRFFTQEGTASTFAALDGVLRRYGRFLELYTDRGSHFCRTAQGGQGPAEEQNGQVTRALHALGIGQILARSPQARGRSERAFGTIQGRLPQELRVNRITDYAAANRYLEEVFIPDFNRRFTVRPAHKESAFVKLAGIELELVLSAREERVVRNDNTVGFHNLILQLPPSRHRIHFVRCPVTVHQFSDGNLGISYQGRLLARYDRGGELLHPTTPNKVRAASVQPPGQPTDAVAAAAPHWRTRSGLSHFPARTPQAGEGTGGKMSIGQAANSTSGGNSPCPAASL
jgi:transposase